MSLFEKSSAKASPIGLVLCSHKPIYPFPPLLGKSGRPARSSACAGTLTKRLWRWVRATAFLLIAFLCASGPKEKRLYGFAKLKLVCHWVFVAFREKLRKSFTDGACAVFAYKITPKASLLRLTKRRIIRTYVPARRSNDPSFSLRHTKLYGYFVLPR